MLGGEIEFLDDITVTGTQGVEQWITAMNEVWRDLHFEVDEVEALDAERVLAMVRLCAVGKESGVAVESRMAQLWTLRDGRAVRMHIYPTKSEALEAGRGP